MTLVLPYPPSVNHLYYTHGGRRHLSREGRSYHAKVAAAALDQRAFVFAPTVRLRYALDLYPPDRRVRDLSNAIKAVEDALTKAKVWHDDSQVDHLTIARCEPVKGGRAEIRIEAITQGASA